MSTQVPTNSIEIVGDEIPGKVRLTMRSADGEWMTTYLDAGEVAAIHAALSAFVPEPEVRGYVVMSKGGSGEPLLAYLDLYRTRERAEHVAETLRDGTSYGLPADPEAHVGVVTALPAEAGS